MNEISDKYRDHYIKTFERHGATSDGVAWGKHKDRAATTYDTMLAVLDPARSGTPSLLDVGCGYGALFPHALERGISLDYSGMDIAPNMIAWGTEHYPDGTFHCADFLDWKAPRRYDYVVCNGILTLKLDVPILEMDGYSHSVVKKMWEIAEVGIAFNMITTRVNFHQETQYYRNPVEMLGWCMSEISPHARLDHAYAGFIYTIYLYREPLSSGSLLASRG